MKVQFEVSKKEIMRALLIMGSSEEDTEKIMNEVEKTDILVVSDEVKKDLLKSEPLAQYLIPIIAIMQITLNTDGK